VQELKVCGEGSRDDQGVSNTMASEALPPTGTNIVFITLSSGGAKPSC
jgi:hypothetical protein